VESLVKANKPNSTAKIKVERVNIDKEISQALAPLVQQVKAELGDFFEVTQKLVVNFILKEKAKAPFSKSEMAQIKKENFDVVRVLRRATEDALTAQKNGANLDLAALVAKLNSPNHKVATDSCELDTKKSKKKKLGDSLKNADSAHSEQFKTEPFEPDLGANRNDIEK